MDRINISDTLLSDNTLGSNNTRASLSTTVNNYSDLTYATNGNRTMNGSIINAHHTNGTTASYAYDYEEGNDDEEEEEITPSELIEKLQQVLMISSIKTVRLNNYLELKAKKLIKIILTDDNHYQLVD